MHNDSEQEGKLEKELAIEFEKIRRAILDSTIKVCDAKLKKLQHENYSGIFLDLKKTNVVPTVAQTIDDLEEALEVEFSKLKGAIFFDNSNEIDLNLYTGLTYESYAESHENYKINLHDRSNNLEKLKEIVKTIAA